MSATLFLLKPNFADSKAGSQLFYCPECATITGVLAYFPQLREKIDVCEVDFPRPRAEVAAIFGSEHPGCPLLVFDEQAAPSGIAALQTASNGRKYLAGATDIGNYLAQAFGVSAPHP